MRAVVDRNAAPFSPRAERERLHAVCLRLTGSRDAADDLAQEAILIGLRRADSGGNAPRDWSPYLFGIARKLCASWRARRGLDEAHTVSLDAESALDDFALADLSAPDPLETLLDGEREQLLDAALVMLKPSARQTLIARYVDGLPLREIAAQSGVSENAATVRVHRGLDALRNVLQTTLRPQAAAHGLLTPEAAQGWRETLLFCPRCATSRLQGRFVPGKNFALRCLNCTGMLDGMTSRPAPMDTGAVLAGVQGFRAGLNRVNAWWQGYLDRALRERVAPCQRCAFAGRVEISDAPDSPGLGVWCDRCAAWTFYIHPTGLLYHSDALHDFWRRFPRMKNEPPRDVVCEGRPAIVTAFADRVTSARVEMVFDKQTLRVMRTS